MSLLWHYFHIIYSIIKITKQHAIDTWNKLLSFHAKTIPIINATNPANSEFVSYNIVKFNIVFILLRLTHLLIYIILFTYIKIYGRWGYRRDLDFLRLLPQSCGDTTRWSAGKVAKAWLNVIYMPCDTKAWTVILD